MSKLLNVSLRQKAVFVPKMQTQERQKLRETTAELVANLSLLGYGVSEELLYALNNCNPKFQLRLLQTFKEVMGVNKNWTPLVKQWNIPTGESRTDHIMSFFATVLQAKGTRLACGHIIPEGTFNLERYNGCPVCGTPFEFGKLKLRNQGFRKKILELWTEDNLYQFFKDLLNSKTALDATQMDSLKILLAELPLPKDAKIAMKETLMAVIDILIEQNKAEVASQFFTSPTDILRYLWYKHTGFLQIIEPKTIVKRKTNNNRNIAFWRDESTREQVQTIKELKLKYNREQCKMVATWLNNLSLAPEKACEIMHPKRNMWVRFIRALRLVEYSKKKGFERLKKLLEVFHNEKYTVWQGKVDKARLGADDDLTLELLKQRPGVFARNLFANMLWFGPEKVIKNFGEVVDKVPARLVFTLNMYADNYFEKEQQRSVKPLGGTQKMIPPHSLLELYSDKGLKAMKSQIEGLCILAIKKRFAKMENENKTIFIDPQLFKIPVSIGDRSESVQDMPSALMGTRFPVEGDTVRLFMQWGEGLPAQHLDMDLSCKVEYPNNKIEFCSYAQLTIKGCQHSGDIQHIPNKVGTAEYIDINVKKLRKEGAKYVSFTCNAYSNGSITPNLVVGWMNSKNPMKITKKGVAYDPSCVQHQVRITQGLSKGLVFGVLDMQAKEIIWLELPFAGQVVQNLHQKGVEAFLKKLDSKLNVGELLKVKAEAQGLDIWEYESNEEGTKADEIYDQQWAMNPALVTQLLVD